MAHNPNVNDTRLADFTKQVAKFGRDAADGQDALPRLAMAAAAAAFDDVIDDEPKKHTLADGSTCDDAVLFYTQYLNESGKKQQYADYKASGIKANASKLRQIIAMGKRVGPGPLVRAHEIRAEMAASKVVPLSAYPMFVNVAREQIKLDRPITDDEIRACGTKPPTAAKDVQAYVERAIKGLDALISGENPDGVVCQAEQIINARESLNAFLTICDRKAKAEAFMAQAAAYGVKVVVEDEGFAPAPAPLMIEGHVN
jgi:hypothetical protein